MNEADRDLLVGEALGVLSPDEEKHIAELVAKDSGAAKELGQHRATVAALEAGVARAQPSADLFDRILAEVQPDPPRLAPAASRRRWSWAPRLAIAGAAAAAVVLGITVFTGGGDDPDLLAQVAGTEQFAAVGGEASLYGPDRSEGELVLELENVPAPPAGHHYEVWVLRTEGGGEMESVGSFTPEGESARLELPLPGPGDYQAVDVSVEPDGGPPEHSNVSLAGGSFQS